MASLPDLIQSLVYAFPRQPVKDETVRLYVTDLADLPPAVVEEAIVELRRTREFFPSISEIRGAAAEKMLGIPDEPQALLDLERHVYWQAEWKPCGACNTRGWVGEGETEAICDRCSGNGRELANSRPLLHPAVQEALDLLGGHHGYRATDEPAVARGQFLKLYRQIRARTLLQTQAGLALPPGRERRELPAHAA